MFIFNDKVIKSGDFADDSSSDTGSGCMWNRRTSGSYWERHDSISCLSSLSTWLAPGTLLTSSSVFTCRHVYAWMHSFYQNTHEHFLYLVLILLQLHLVFPLLSHFSCLLLQSLLFVRLSETRRDIFRFKALNNNWMVKYLRKKKKHMKNSKV